MRFRGWLSAQCGCVWSQRAVQGSHAETEHGLGMGGGGVVASSKFGLWVHEQA